MSDHLTREQIIDLVEALADNNAQVRLSAWRCAGEGEQLRRHQRDWTGPYRYELYARFPAGMSAAACGEIAAIAEKFGCEATLWDSGGESDFRIAPPSRLQIDTLVRR